MNDEWNRKQNMSRHKINRNDISDEIRIPSYVL